MASALVLHKCGCGSMKFEGVWKAYEKTTFGRCVSCGRTQVPLEPHAVPGQFVKCGDCKCFYNNKYGPCPCIKNRKAKKQ